MSGRNPSYVAGGDITPSRFVKLNGTDDRTVVLAGAGEAAVGVSHEGTREAPIPGITPKTAIAGEGVYVYGDGDECEVFAAGTIAPGDEVMSDAAGAALVCTATNHALGKALHGAVAGELCRIQVHEAQIL